MEEEAEVNTTKTPRRSPRLLDQLPASQLPPIAEEEDVDRDTAEAPKRIPRSLHVTCTYIIYHSLIDTDVHTYTCWLVLVYSSYIHLCYPLVNQSSKIK